MKKLVLLILISTMSLNAQERPFASISVSGEGIVKVVPDEAVINIRVEHQGNEPGSVKSRTDDVVDGVIKYCRQLEIKENDLSTERVYLNKNYDYKLKRYHYTASQSLKIVLRDLDLYEKLTEGLIKKGINRLDGVHFRSSKAKDLKARARVKAIQHARQKAREYAQAVGQEVGKAVTITESGGYSPAPRFRSVAFADAEMAAAPKETLAPGEMEIKAGVQVVFELK